MKFNATADVKGEYTSQLGMKLYMVADEPKNTASTEMKMKGKRWSKSKHKCST